MSTWLDPIGPHSRSVYWRRRAAAGGALLLVLFLVSRACGSDQPPDLIRAGATQTPVPLVSTYTPTPTPAPTPTATMSGPASGAAAATAAETASGTASGTAPETPGVAGPGRAAAATTTAPPKPVRCAKDDIEVTVWTEARRYAPQVNPRLFISVLNRGNTACRFDVGSKALTLVVSSGNDRVWSSDDCQGLGTSDERLLAPGKPFAATAVWTRVRSEVGCPKGQPAAKPGTYLLSGSANDVEQQRRAVFLLD